MRKLFCFMVTIILIVMFALPLAVMGDNVALTKPVTLYGNFNFQSIPPDYVPAPASSLVDGVYLEEGNYWAQNTVFWSPYIQGNQGEQYITIDLLTPYTITGFSVQADDNDRYLLSYWDSSSSGWLPIWLVPSSYDDPSVGGGMRTRSETLGSSIVTSMLRFEGVYSEGQVFSDNWFAVSEIQAYGPSTSPVPEPATMLLLGSGLIGLAGYGRKKFFKK